MGTTLETYRQAGELEERARRVQAQAAAKGGSWGATVVKSEQLVQAANSSSGSMSPVKVGNLGQLVGSTKAIYAGTDATGGAAVATFRADTVNAVRVRRPSVLDLVNVVPVNTDAVEYAEISTITDNAAPVAEYSGGTFGLKPESDMTFSLRTANVKTIATWVAASRQILRDAPRLQATIDGLLTAMVRKELEDQIISGDGAGNNLTGILNWSGIQSRVHQTSGRDFSATDTVSDTLKRALTDIELEEFEADGIVMNPADFESLALERAGTAGGYLYDFDRTGRRVWDTPIVVTTATPAGTAIVANFELAVTLFDREDVQVLTGQPNDYFLRNAYAVLAELRATMGVILPKAIVKVTGL